MGFCELKLWWQSHPVIPVVGVEMQPHFTLQHDDHINTDFIPSKSNMVFTWFRCAVGKVVVGSSSTYVPSFHDAGHGLMMECYVIDDQGAITSNHVRAMFAQVMPLFPSIRPLLFTQHGFNRSAKPPSPEIMNSAFRVVSYNLLADVYVNSGKYTYDHCPRQTLTWEYRRKNLLRELLSYRADILCLQEVQSDHFYNFFEPQLARFGYLAIYKKKGRNLYFGGEYISDGCATFYLCPKFRLVKKYDIEYAKMALPVINKLTSEQRSEAFGRLMKDNVATVAIFENSRSQSRVCVANTHLASGMGLADVRAFQVASLVQGLQKIDSLGIPTLICGDLNSTPHSDTYRYLMEGEVNCLKQDILGFSRHVRLDHSMHLSSAYLGALNEHRDDILDYIMYSRSKLKVDGVAEFPFYETICGKRQLPTPQLSSDHVALVADLRVRKGYRSQNYSHLPVDPWEELKREDVKKVEVDVKDNLGEWTRNTQLIQSH